MYTTGVTLGMIMFVYVTSASSQDILPDFDDYYLPDYIPDMMELEYKLPIDDSITPSHEVPRIYQHSGDAGPDQTFFLVGSNLTEEVFVWGRDADNPEGKRWAVKTYLVNDNYLSVTLPDRCPDSLFIVWVKNYAGWSRPFRINTPQSWWCWPKEPLPGQDLSIFGRDLGRRPDRTTAFVYLASDNSEGEWLDVLSSDKYTVTVYLPYDLLPGDYKLWFHAGCGGCFGWGEPLSLKIAEESEEVYEFAYTPPYEKENLQDKIDDLQESGGGVLKLDEGVYEYKGTLEIPRNVTVEGEGLDRTILQVVQSEPQDFACITSATWNQAPGRVHTPGDIMEYKLSVPASGKWAVWLRYATEMSPWNQPGVSGNMVIEVDDGNAVKLDNLSNTGSFGTFKWSHSADIELEAGTHILRWRNVKGGGISLDAFVFALNPDYEPSDSPFPETGKDVIVLQGENVTKFQTKEGVLPGRMTVAVALTGDNAAIKDLTISANPQISDGVIIQSNEPLKWVKGCQIEGCRIADMEGKHAEICGVRFIRAKQAIVTGNEIWGRSPLYFSGIRNCNISNNKLIPVTRFGANSEAAMQGRNEVIEECVIENNLVASPPGAEAGSPQTRRLIWVSTGRGSVTKNWFANNGVVQPQGPGSSVGAGQMRFGGVAGTDQNVGEMILFEANHRTMYFGPLVGGDKQSVLLPETIPPTPENRLGSVEREQLAYDEEGNETPFWPPDVEDGSPEPPITEYYVSIFKGKGQGQTRRVVKREGETLILDRPWRVAPEEGSVVAVGTAFYRNHIVGNYTPDGMTGIQLWISCMENIASGNTIARMRRPAFYLYSNGTTLASSMPRRWNRGISPLFFNHIEGNYSHECSAGALVTSGDYPDIPIEFPRALGNVIRQNSFIKSRNDGVIIVSRKGNAADGDTSPSILGTIVEFNVVRDAAIAYHSSNGSDGVLFRRNHAYFWYPVSNSDDPPIAFQIDRAGADVIIEDNSVEGKVGEMNPKYSIIIKKPIEE
ncbi:hypothetical protein GF312_14925 [Candidatus Poribacteria bacterium]|nr:hypothetical protein [Candidatus Poribacteria bacterium]